MKLTYKQKRLAVRVRKLLIKKLCSKCLAVLQMASSELTMEEANDLIDYFEERMK